MHYFRFREILSFMTTLRVVPNEPQSLTGVVAKRIRVFLAEYNIKQVQLAKAIGMSTAALSKRISGKQELTLHDIEQFSDALGVQPEVFLAGAPTRPNGPDDGGSRLGESNPRPIHYKGRHTSHKIDSLHVTDGLRKTA